ncbi:aliphatic sulfonate ABC transporter ATP-binding protein [Cohnella sp. CIP 111063]|uniref:ATP-binding cassette domain-containing protein n=1 Tax=unclassified Cohnella TaxID=2636738 RepID=UPI000B8BE788|nr:MULTISPECIES: ATP-binding cassette domain-containing protein [unclassified Cohnella]OXS57697.1 aliphatic sulfonate ABC transporter ATP-binding protein [Cohnella sp. CIP 111063]PRX71089.1 sulfonate transport system ATP-binding protein [Cohnella sp. SGD-V74]
MSLTIRRGARLQVRGASKKFGDKEVLQGVELDIPAGQFVAIVGRSGCGKSTLLRLIAGLEEPTEGDLSLDSSEIAGIREDTRMLFQDARLLPWKRALANVQVGVKSRDADEALKALEQVGLADRAGEWPGVLSGGQRQRVALARALASSPRLLLLDEPLGALDALTRIDMQQLIEQLWEDQRFTAVLVTHDVSEAVALADRVVLIENGRIALDVNIALDRPRERDSGFAHYEKLILDRILERDDSSSTTKRKVSYSI